MSWPTVAIILRAELRAWRNRIVRGNTARIALLAILGPLAALFLGGSLFAVALAAGHLLPSARDAVLAGAFTGLSVLMLVVGFPTVIATYFAGRDLMQLIVAPVPTFEIFLARSLFAMSANLLVALLALTFVVGLGVGSGASPAYYPLALILVFVQVLLVSSLQATLMAAVLQWVPARIARDAAVAAAGIAAAGLYLVWNITIRRSFATRAGPDIAGTVAQLRRVEWLPSAWPGHALSSTLTGEWAAALAWTALTLLLAAAAVTASAALYERTLLAGLGLLGGVPATWNARSARPLRTAARGSASPELAIVRKDWIAYRRDIRRLSRFLPAALFIVAYGFVLVRPTGGPGVFWNDALVVGFISLFMSMMFAAPSIPGERRGFQLLRLAPITFWQLIRAKVLFTIVPVLVLTISLSLTMSILGGGGLVNTLQILAFVIWLGVGCVCIGVSAGAIDPKFDSTDDRRSLGLAGTFAAIGAEIAFGLASVGSLALLRAVPGVAGGTDGLVGLPASPVLAVGAAGVAVLLAAGGAALVGAMLWTANWRLRSFEASITTA